MAESLNSINKKKPKNRLQLKQPAKKPISQGILKKPKILDMSSKKRLKLQEFAKISRELHSSCSTQGIKTSKRRDKIVDYLNFVQNSYCDVEIIKQSKIGRALTGFVWSLKNEPKQRSEGGTSQREILGLAEQTLRHMQR